MLAACSGKPAANNQAAPANVTAAAAAPSDSGGVNPLGSQAVKDAIHRALRTGQTQRWSDAGLSGYAVPSPTADARGCRTVRYTIDQQPARSFPVITACDAG
jgi:post-segregation antitoxin (ccd killing protein)